MARCFFPSVKILLSSALAFLIGAFSTQADAAIAIPLTIHLSEAVTVTGTPRVTVDVGGHPRFATYTSGSGTDQLTFTLTPQIGDVDLDGITVSSPIDLNGGTIKDAAGNDALLTFPPPTTSGIKVNYPSLGMDFIYDADGRYSVNGTVYNDLPSFLTASGGGFLRSSTGTYFDSAGVMQTAGIHSPRFEYDPVTHAAKGLLIEESRTNGLKYSEQFDNAVWFMANVAVSANAATAPDGASSADKITETADANQHYWHQNYSYISGTTYTHSFYVKAGEKTTFSIHLSTPAFGSGTNGRGIYNLSTETATITGTGATGGILSVGNGWYRCWITQQATASSNAPLYLSFGTISSYTGDGVSGLYIWGAQLEAGAFPTSYIQTTSASVTRSPDRLLISTGSWFNAAEGTLVSLGTIRDSGSAVRRFMTLSDGSINNSIQLAHSYLNLSTYLEVRDTVTVQAAATTGSFASGALSRIGAAYKLNDFGISSNGSAVATDTSGTVPAALSELRVGSHAGGGSIINGHMQLARYYPLRVSNAQLQLLSQ